ncbi:MAG: aa3-type cytochrome c oxidase subunit IV [Pseudomonadota bacterium]
MSDHEHGKMDITEQEKTFEGFIKFWIYLFAASAAVLIFLALFNS